MNCSLGCTPMFLTGTLALPDRNPAASGVDMLTLSTLLDLEACLRNRESELDKAFDGSDSAGSRITDLCEDSKNYPLC